ncbi:MAG TPA: tetratricopeptide repeat protein [Terracidiphilus sp.]|jgi:tetratricopeptide (TPR) repeat protein
MMRKLLPTLDLALGFAAAILFLLPLVPARAQQTPASSPSASPAKDQPNGAPAKTAPVETAKADAGSKPAVAAPTSAAQTAPNRAQAYYHLALASVYEDDAISEGRTDEVNQAIEQYKLALDADPDSAELSDDLADLYFRADRVHDAETTAHSLLKSHPDDIDAHRLLGRIYLRQLGENQNGGAPAANSSNVLDQAIAEFERIVALQPNSVEDRMVLGQLYTVKHQPEKAESEFKTAQAIEPESEDVVLNLARLYAESGDVQHAVKAIEAVPVDGRTPKMEFTLGALYDQLKQPKDAIAAYQRADDLEPGDLQTMDALAAALLSSDQLDQSLKEYQALAEADPENTEALVHIGEIQRRQHKYEDALATIRKARKIDPTSLDAGYNEGLLFDVLGRFDEAIQTYQEMVDATSHANGAYKEDEKNNRAIFLERLGAVYLEENKTDQAVATYQKMIDMGGSYAAQAYQGQVDAYRNAHQFAKAIEISRKAVAANPQDRDLKLMLATELVDQDHPDDGLAMAKGMLDGANPDQQRAVWIALVQMNIRLRRWKDAEDALDKAAPLATKTQDRTNIFFLRGEWAERQKHDDQAEQYFRQALNLDPANAMTLNYLGYMWADKGIKLTEALKMIRQAVDSEPMNGAFLDSLGWAYFKMGEYELAEDNLRQAVNRDQTDPTVHMHLGDLYEKTGRIRLAAAQWQLSLDEFAKSSPADIEPGDVDKVQKKLEGARVRLAKEDSSVGQAKPE